MEEEEEEGANSGYLPARSKLPRGRPSVGQRWSLEGKFSFLMAQHWMNIQSQSDQISSYLLYEFCTLCS